MSNYYKQEYRDHVEERFKSLVKDFGEDFIKPQPEYYGLDSKLITSIESHNRNVDLYNSKLKKTKYIFIYAFFVFLCIVFYIFEWDLTAVFILSYILTGLFAQKIVDKFLPIKKIHDLTYVLDNYRWYVKKYPTQDEIIKIKYEYEEIQKVKMNEQFWYSLDGMTFEKEIEQLFIKIGYTDVVKTKGSGDGGVDIIMKDDVGNEIFVQCKAHKKPVGPHVVRDLYGAMTSGNVKEGILVSLAGVTKGAQDFITGKNITVLNVNRIMELQSKVNKF